MDLIKRFRHPIGIVALLLAVLVLTRLFHAEGPFKVQPQVEQGQLDLTGWSFEQDGNIRLDGEWAFYWDKLLSPQDLAAPSAPAADAYLPVPGPWSKPVAGTAFPKLGKATYRLRVQLPEAGMTYGIKTVNIRMASRIYINGIEIGQSGNPGGADGQGYVMRNMPNVRFFAANQRELDVLIQVADYEYKSGGITQGIYLGHQGDILQQSQRLWFFDSMVMVSLAGTGLYYLFIYFGRSRDRSLLYYSLYSFIIAMAESANGEKLMLVLFPQLSFERMMQIKCICLCASVILLCLFVNKVVQGLLSRWFLLTVALVFGAGGIGLLLLLPFKAYAGWEDPVIVLGLLVHVFVIARLIAAIVKKRCGDAGVTVVVYLLLGFTCVFVTFVDSVLYLNNLKNDDFIAKAAVLGFVATITIMISYQQTMARRTIESMSLKLLELDRLKDEFIANTSHELRTPLNGIINITNSVLEGSGGTLSPLTRTNLEVVVAAARKLHNLLHDILDISSLKHGLRLNVRAVDVYSVAEVVLYEIRHTRAGQEIEIVNRIPPDLPPVYADAERLRQILYNLADNALKFTPQGSIEAGACVCGEEAEIWVEDTGCGIPADKLEDIFTSFYQVNTDEMRSSGGTGLGLSISKTLVQLHGGRIWATSTVDKGTRITFTLPLSTQAKTALPLARHPYVSPEVASASALLTTSARKEKARYSILAADDDSSNLTALFGILSNEGYYIKSVASGEEVLQELERKKDYNLLIMDLMMPRMSGYEVLRNIRSRFTPLHLPVLLLTAKMRPEDLQAGFQAGANDYVAKPFEALELKARVRTLVQLKETASRMVTTELSFLQAQIKPHFLFNTLSVIASLSTRHPERAKQVLYDLSDYLRGSFNFENYNGITPLSGELATVRAYLSIEKERFREKLHVVYEIDEEEEEELSQLPIPLLAIQPLVENAIRHGILKKPTGGTVKLTIRNNGASVMIQVWDNGVGMSEATLEQILQRKPPKYGVGLINIEQRLLLHYGHGLEISSQEGVGTTVVMRIPYVKKE